MSAWMYSVAWLMQGIDANPLGLIDLLAKGSSIVLAVMLVLIVFGYLVPGGIYKEALSREKALAEQLDEARKVSASFAVLAREMMDELKAIKDRK